MLSEIQNKKLRFLFPLAQLSYSNVFHLIHLKVIMSRECSCDNFGEMMTRMQMFHVILSPFTELEICQIGVASSCEIWSYVGAYMYFQNETIASKSVAGQSSANLNLH